MFRFNRIDDLPERCVMRVIQTEICIMLDATDVVEVACTKDSRQGIQAGCQIVRQEAFLGCGLLRRAGADGRLANCVAATATRALGPGSAEAGAAGRPGDAVQPGRPG